MMFFILTLPILLGPARLIAQEKPEADATPTFKAGAVDVRLDVQVVDGRKIITGLTADDFAVTDEGQPQKIAYFAQDNEPLNLIVLLDISGSMQRYIAQIAQTARNAMNFLKPGDRVAIMVFGKRAELHQEFSDNLAETARQIGLAVEEHDVGAGTLINAAVVEAAHYMDSHAGPNGRRAILILTDNLSLSYQLTSDRVIRELNKADAVMNAIVTGRAIRPKPLEPGKYANPDFTPSDVFYLSEQTGGEAVKADQAGSSFREMIERIRTRYTLAYPAPPSTPGAFRHVEVALTPLAKRRFPTAEIHTRNGYYTE
jgi:Ca-activated chloride channel family protein